MFSFIKNILEVDITLRLFKELAEHRLLLIVIYGISILEALLASLSISMLIPLTEAFMNTNNTVWILQYFPDFIKQSPAHAIAAFGIILVIKTLVSLARFSIIVIFGEGLRKRWQIIMAERIFFQEYTRFIQIPRGVFLENLTRIPDFAAMFIIKWLNYSTQLTLLIALYCTLLIINWQAAIGFLVCVICVWFLGGRKYFSWSHKIGKQTVQLNQSLSAKLTSSLTGIKEIKISSNEKFTLKGINKIATQVKQIRIINKFAASFPTYAAEFTIGVTVICFAWYIAISETDISVFIPLLVFIIGSFVRIMSTASSVASERYKSINKMYAFDLLVKELSSPLQKENYDKGASLPHNQNDPIIFKDLSFTYPTLHNKQSNATSPIIQNFNLTLEPGTSTALYGPSGSGKTTIIDLLMRLYTPDSGHLYLGDKKITEFALGAWRQQIGYVSQEPVLFNGTLKQNILIGRQGSSDEDIMQFCKIAQIDDFIKNSQEGLLSLVTDGGNNLSGGQKRRIALVRALIGKPRLLILDEATNALDEDMEKKLLLNLKKIGSLSVLIISHRETTSNWVDYVIRLEKT